MAGQSRTIARRSTGEVITDGSDSDRDGGKHGSRPAEVAQRFSGWTRWLTAKGLPVGHGSAVSAPRNRTTELGADGHGR